MVDSIRICQFGEGNFLRAFVDWMMTPDSVIIVKPRPGRGLEKLLSCNCRYSVGLQGIDNGETINVVEPVDSIAGAINPYEQYEKFLEIAMLPNLKVIVSNTTEAGIQYNPECLFTDKPALSYPGKLTQLLYHRWQYFHGDKSRGVIILPCELIFHNGTELKHCMSQYIDLWQLETEFREWVETCCPIYNTLVDRIVSGGDDPLVVKAEPYHLWVIEGPDMLKNMLPLRDVSLNILFTDDEEPYHQRKLTLLNAPHTAMSAVGHLAGLETVRDCMLHPVISSYVQSLMIEELLPTIALPLAESQDYAQSVKERFLNPYVHHLLTSIMLNNLAKYRTRDLPALHWHVSSRGILPKNLTIALAANLVCAGKTYEALSDAEIWGEDLTLIPELENTVRNYMEQITNEGILTLL